MNINKVMIFGNITRDPEVKQLPNGMSVSNVSIATNRYYNNQNNEKVEEVEYHSISFFGKLAELVQQYLTKGSSVYVEGRLRTRSWEDDAGKKHYKTEIIAEQMQFGPRKADSSNKQPQSNTSESKVPDGTINPDDIPF